MVIQFNFTNLRAHYLIIKFLFTKKDQVTIFIFILQFFNEEDQLSILFLVKERKSPAKINLEE